MPPDYYRALGVSRDATPEEIKKAFRRLARETHPDANPGDPAAEARFRQAAEAYEVLSDPEKRRHYDRGGTVDLNDLLSGFGGIDDILRSVFGDGGVFGSRQPRRPRGRDILAPAVVSLEEAAFGAEVAVDYNTTVTCSVCSGSGSEPGTGRTTCTDCGGSGELRVTQRSVFGTMLTSTVCSRCAGVGSWVTTPCGECDGAGAVPERVEVLVEVPPGISSGTRLRMSGRGEVLGDMGAPGDLYVELSVSDHPLFERHDNDLWYSLKLGIAEAALGAKVEVPLIEGGSVSLEIPSGTQPGEVFRFSGRGMTILGRRDRGDLIVVATVEIPDRLSADEEGLMRRWSDLRGERTDRPASAT